MNLSVIVGEQFTIEGSSNHGLVDSLRGKLWYLDCFGYFSGQSG